MIIPTSTALIHLFSLSLVPTWGVPGTLVGLYKIQSFNPLLCVWSNRGSERLRKFCEVPEQPQPVHFRACMCASLFYSFVFLHVCVSVSHLYFFIFKFMDKWYLILSCTPGKENKTPNGYTAADKSWRRSHVCKPSVRSHTCGRFCDGACALSLPGCCFLLRCQVEMGFTERCSVVEEFWSERTKHQELWLGLAELKERDYSSCAGFCKPSVLFSGCLVLCDDKQCMVLWDKLI